MKRQRMRDKNSSLFISLLKLVNFNNTFALLLYFFLCQDTSGKMFLSIHENKFPPKFNFCMIRQIKFCQITSLLRSAKISSLKVFFIHFYNHLILNFISKWSLKMGTAIIILIYNHTASSGHRS